MKSTQNSALTFATLLFVFLLLSSLAAFAAFDANKANTVTGNATIGGAYAKDGTVIDVFIGSASSPITSYSIGSEEGVGKTYFPDNFTVDFQCNAASTAFLKVWGINATSYTCVAKNFNSTNLSVSLTANDGSCKYGNGCSSGVCCSGSSSVNSSTSSGTCKSSCAAASTDPGGGGGASGGGGGGAAAPPPAPEAPSQETVDIVKESLPPAFQQAAAAGNIEYKTVAAPEIKEVPAKAEAASSAIEYAVDYLAKTEEAQQALSAIQEAVSSGGASTVQAAGGSVSKTIEVVTATNKATKEEVTVSVVKLTVEAKTADLKNVEVVEVIPKAAASNVNQVTFTGEKPAVLEADPVVKWFFAQVAKGQKKDLSYAINKDIRNIGTSTVAVQGRAEAAPAAVPAPPEAPAPAAGEKPGEAKKPTPLNTVVLVVIVAVVVVGGWLFLKGRKKVMK